MEAFFGFFVENPFEVEKTPDCFSLDGDGAGGLGESVFEFGDAFVLVEELGDGGGRDCRSGSGGSVGRFVGEVSYFDVERVELGEDGFGIWVFDFGWCG